MSIHIHISKRFLLSGKTAFTVQNSLSTLLCFGFCAGLFRFYVIVFINALIINVVKKQYYLASDRYSRRPPGRNSHISGQIQ